MISPRLKAFLERIDCAYLATADPRSRPHLAVGNGVRVIGSNHLLLDGWGCPRTLENVAEVPRVALAVIDPPSGHGYQIEGFVEELQFDDSPPLAPPTPLTGLVTRRGRILLRVEAIFEFTPGWHSDTPLGKES